MKHLSCKRIPRSTGAGLGRVGLVAFVAFVALAACDRSATTGGSAPSSSSTPSTSGSGPSTGTNASANPSASSSANAVAQGAQGPIPTVTLPDVFIADNAKTTIHVAWKIPPGTGINDDAPFKVRWTTSEGLSEVPPDEKSKGADVKLGFDVVVAPLAGEPAAHLAGTVDVVVCDVETHKVCVPVKRKIEVTFAVQKGGKKRTSVEVELPAARPQQGS